MIRALWALSCRIALIAAAGLFLFSGVGFCVQLPWIPLVMAVGIGLRHTRKWRGSWAHGTSRFATTNDLENAHMLGDEGLILGRCWTDRPGWMAGVRALISPRVRSDIVDSSQEVSHFRSQN